jgi:hypothetical protein
MNEWLIELSQYDFNSQHNLASQEEHLVKWSNMSEYKSQQNVLSD